MLMARRYSGKKGKSGSKSPVEKKSPIWVRYKPKEIEMLIVKLAKEGQTSSEIGIHLRDSYGVPSVKDITGKSITKIMSEKNLLPKLPEDLMNLMRRALKLRDHLEENHGDTTAKRGLEITESKVRRLVKYYQENEKIPADWKYNPKEAKLYVE